MFAHGGAMARTIILQSAHISATSLEPLLKLELGAGDVRLKLERTRSLEAAILIAIVGATGTALGALITGVLKVAAQKGAQNVVIHGQSGRKIEVPADTTAERLEEFVRLAKDLDVDRIIF
jgi:hypothetical protein